jgi:hypothetical protein
VNSFRVVFDAYFGAAIPLVEDKSFFSPFDMPYQFTLVTREMFSRKVDLSRERLQDGTANEGGADLLPAE